MKKSRVFFTDIRSDTKRNLFDKIDGLLNRVGLEGKFGKGELVAVKLHFGERGNTSYIRPNFVRRVVDNIKDTGARPFLTDTNTLYVGSRAESASHLVTAIENGFDYAVAGAPLIIADGLRSENVERVPVEGRHFREVSIGGSIASADGMVVLTHFKCHELTGFGGAIKNLGMGCAAREGKLAQHSELSPVVDREGCTACATCIKWCPAGAIEMVKGKAFIDEETCIGCGKCIIVCPEKTIRIRWSGASAAVQEKMAEYATGAVKGKRGKQIFLNFIVQVTPSCDCYGHTDAPIVPDVGILASADPVAIDQASADLVNMQAGLANTALATGHEPGGDKFRGVHPEVDWEVQLEAAAGLGLGEREYDLVDIG